MALLELKDIGKIYVSEGAVSVGIRGVHLSFERGEFVAITGQSGSGKSTLLNVISGMDSYEEGELYIEGEQTSHYIQADWEKYREKYISFIFQEYNIIESFTVLENVELALMHIENAKERRERALELIRKVGLEEHIKHKGSHLSGGQKQRTVIARALAKDSPIILADEPTGNLDSKTSEEIIQLLKEVSQDKLLIVVTHNFEEVEAYATREIRVFDGAIAADKRMSEELNLSGNTEVSDTSTMDAKHNVVKNSLSLGWSIFKSMPRLSVFMCILLLVAGFVVYFAFSLYWSDIRILVQNQNYMFYNPGGRMVAAKVDGEAFSKDELEDIQRLADDTGAKMMIHLDSAYDSSTTRDWKEYYPRYDTWNFQWGNPYSYVTGEDYGELDYGRYPEKDSEAVISLPYFMHDLINESTINGMPFSIGQEPLKIVGIHYYLESERQGQLLVTEEAFREASCLSYFDNGSKLVMVNGTGAYITILFDSSVPVGEYYVPKSFLDVLNTSESIELVKRNDFDPGKGEIIGVSVSKDAIKLSKDNEGYVRVNSETVKDQLLVYMEKNYRQVSVIYPSDSKAIKATKTFIEKGYKVVEPNATYKVYSYFEIIELVLMGVMFLAMWFLIIVFASFFIRICTQKSMDAFKSDIAIMRSMGIRVNEIRAAIYFRIYVCIIPTLLILPIAARLIIRTDFGGRNMTYLHFTELCVILFLLMLVVIRVAKQHVAHLFSENVRKALKGAES